MIAEANRLGKPYLSPCITNLTAANGTPLDARVILKLKLFVKGIEQEINFEVSRAVTESILGEEALSLFRIVKWELPKVEQTENVILSTKATVIPAGKTAQVNCVAGGPGRGRSVHSINILVDCIDPYIFRRVIGVYPGINHKSK